MSTGAGKRRGIGAGLTMALLLAACGGQPPRPPESEAPRPAPRPATGPSKKPQVTLKKGGGFYKDDGPADDIPYNLDEIPDAQPKWEPLHRPATRPYVVLGKEYVPHASLRPYRATGIASWYGKKFHGQKTSIGEPYDMFAMTAAHTTLAIPSYARVTNVQTGRSVVVRVIDRGPFHADRIIDLSYTAAWKLGLVNNGSGQVTVESILPEDYGIYARAGGQPPTQPAQADDMEALARRLAAEEATLMVATAGTATAVQAGGTAVAGSPPAGSAGLYLQLGAFANADNAESLRNHLSRELDWLAEPMRIQAANGIHRLQLGPYGSRDDAGRVAERIRQALGYKPTVVSR